MCFHPTPVDMDVEETKVSNNGNIFCWLHDVIVHMMLFLDFKTLGRAARVSKTWNKCFDDERLWKSKCNEIIEDDEVLQLKEDSTWKTLFIRLSVNFNDRVQTKNPKESNLGSLFRSNRRRKLS